MKHLKELGTRSMLSLLLKQSFPAMIGMLVMTLYNVVDTIFVGHFIGTEAIAGLAIAFPLQMMGVAISLMIGIGTASIISRALGAKKMDVAEAALGNYFFLATFFGTLLTIFAFIFIDQILVIFGATPEIISPAFEYASVIIMGAIPMVIAISSSQVIRAEGKAIYVMGIMLASSILNILLDAIFIILLSWGVAGAAWATVISQTITAVIGMSFFVKNKSAVRLKLSNLIPRKQVLLNILSLGSPSFTRLGAVSISTIALNNILGFYGGTIAIAVYGIINKLLRVVMSPLMGINQGMMPILSYNYGAGNVERVNAVILLSARLATVFAFFFSVLLIVFARSATGIFTSDPLLIENTAYAIRITMIFGALIGFSSISGGIFPAIGKYVPSLVLSLIRPLLVLLPLAFILPIFFGLEGVWYAFPLADTLSFIVALFMVRREIHLLS